uniref:DJP1-like protein n=1 Tax=Nephromyces sp. MMRI TaxID=2496275 RepID=A0A3S8V312_9APIC|nr:DJP1-like protein [Nephromyces sp. MMRI]
MPLKKQRLETTEENVKTSDASSHQTNFDNKQTKFSSRPFYDILGISQDASINEIDKAYKLMAIRVHPDKNLNDANATEKFQQLIKAYETLKDPKKRHLYDLNGSDDAFYKRIY